LKITPRIQKQRQLFDIVTRLQISQMSQKNSLTWTFKMQNTESNKRLSIRRVAIMLGIPARVVARAVASGALPAIKIKTETGRDRAYILYEDAQAWVCTLQQSVSAAK
jgi:hypothetical protein